MLSKKTKMAKTIHKLKQLWVFLHKHLIVVLVLGVVTFAIGAGAVFAAVKTQSDLVLSYSSTGQPVDQPFSVSLGQVVASIDNVSIEPKVDGSWEYHADALGVTGLEFHPTKEFSPGQTYTVRVTGIKRHITGSNDSVEVKFTTEEAPGVLHFSLPSKDGLVVAADETFSIKLKHPRDVVLESEPAVEFSRTAIDMGYNWSAKGFLPQGEKLVVRVKGASDGREVLSRAVQVAASPQVAAVSKESDLLPGDEVVVSFNVAVKPSDKSITTDAPGEGEWSDDGMSYRLKLGDIEPGKQYGLSVNPGLRSKSGGITIDKIDKTLSSRGSVAVVEVSPTGAELTQARQQIAITFNQPVDRSSAESAFSISSGRVTGTSWDGNTMKITVVDLGYQRHVRVGLAAGIRPSGFGLLGRAWGYSFTTEVPTVKLTVPYYRQVYAQSCEAASVRMALAYRGIGSSDWDILQKFGYNPTHKNQETNTWEDPQKQFVGDVNGNQSEGTGWGVFAEPVAAAVRSYGRQASTHYGVSAQLLAQQLYNDRPVVLWGIWGSSARIQTWTTADGGTASGPFPMHVRLVVGVKGSVENPLGFYVHDPITGSAYWSTAQLMSNTQKAGPANQAVVIY